MYPSGRWRGYWEDQLWGRQSMRGLSLRFADGRVEGQGVDVVAPFTFQGQYDANGSVTLVKQYIGRHRVLYRGRYDGEGTIYGEWWIGFTHGPFALSPEDFEVPADTPILTIAAEPPATEDVEFFPELHAKNELSREKANMTSRVDGLAVVLLLSDDPSRTATFYRDVLSVDLIAEEHGGRRVHYGCVLGSIYFTIQYASDFAEPAHGPDSMQLCFTVADMDGFLSHLRERGIAPLHPPRPFEHTVFTTLRDPDGRALRVMTPWQQAART